MATTKKTQEEPLNYARMLRRLDNRIETAKECWRNAECELDRAKRGLGYSPMKAGQITVASAPDDGDVLLYTQEASKYRASMREWTETRAIVEAELKRRGVL